MSICNENRAEQHWLNTLYYGCWNSFNSFCVVFLLVCITLDKFAANPSVPLWWSHAHFNISLPLAHAKVLFYYYFHIILIITIRYRLLPSLVQMFVCLPSNWVCSASEGRVKRPETDARKVAHTPISSANKLISVNFFFKILDWGWGAEYRHWYQTLL